MNWTFIIITYIILNYHFCILVCNFKKNMCSFSLINYQIEKSLNQKYYKHNCASKSLKTRVFQVVVYWVIFSYNHKKTKFFQYYVVYHLVLLDVMSVALKKVTDTQARKKGFWKHLLNDNRLHIYRLIQNKSSMLISTGHFISNFLKLTTSLFLFYIFHCFTSFKQQAK